MPYRFIEEEATADIAFEAWGKDLGEVLRDAADATMNVMVEDLDGIRPRESRTVEVENEAPDLLMLNMLQRLIYHKDAEQLLLRLHDLQVDNSGGEWRLRAIARGEPIDSKRHRLLVDVKAVTLHELRLDKTAEGWRAHVVLDI